eukprot:COSAG06_NODE_333_length_17341_cov_7.601032_4_plen_112_part_00
MCPCLNSAGLSEFRQGHSLDSGAGPARGKVTSQAGARYEKFCWQSVSWKALDRLLLGFGLRACSVLQQEENGGQPGCEPLAVARNTARLGTWLASKCVAGHARDTPRCPKR